MELAGFSKVMAKFEHPALNEKYSELLKKFDRPPKTKHLKIVIVSM